MATRLGEETEIIHQTPKQLPLGVDLLNPPNPFSSDLENWIGPSEFEHTILHLSDSTPDDPGSGHHNLGYPMLELNPRLPSILAVEAHTQFKLAQPDIDLLTLLATRTPESQRDMLLEQIQAGTVLKNATSMEILRRAYRRVFSFFLPLEQPLSSDSPNTIEGDGRRHGHRRTTVPTTWEDLCYLLSRTLGIPTPVPTASGGLLIDTDVQLHESADRQKGGDGHCCIEGLAHICLIRDGHSPRLTLPFLTYLCRQLDQETLKSLFNFHVLPHLAGQLGRTCLTGLTDHTSLTVGITGQADDGKTSLAQGIAREFRDRTSDGNRLARMFRKYLPPHFLGQDMCGPSVSTHLGPGVSPQDRARAESSQRQRIPGTAISLPFAIRMVTKGLFPNIDQIRATPETIAQFLIGIASGTPISHVGLTFIDMAPLTVKPRDISTVPSPDGITQIALITALMIDNLVLLRQLPDKATAILSGLIPSSPSRIFQLGDERPQGTALFVALSRTSPLRNSTFHHYYKDLLRSVHESFEEHMYRCSLQNHDLAQHWLDHHDDLLDLYPDPNELQRFLGLCDKIQQDPPLIDAPSQVYTVMDDLRQQIHAHPIHIANSIAARVAYSIDARLNNRIFSLTDIPRVLDHMTNGSRRETTESVHKILQMTAVQLRDQGYLLIDILDRMRMELLQVALAEREIILRPDLPDRSTLDTFAKICPELLATTSLPQCVVDAIEANTKYLSALVKIIDEYNQPILKHAIAIASSSEQMDLLLERAKVPLLSIPTVKPILRNATSLDGLLALHDASPQAFDYLLSCLDDTLRARLIY